MERIANATREDLTQRCGHECLKPPDHDGAHFYGYIGGPHSYEGLLAENDRMREALEQIACYDPQGGQQPCCFAARVLAEGSP